MRWRGTLDRVGLVAYHRGIKQTSEKREQMFTVRINFDHVDAGNAEDAANHMIDNLLEHMAHVIVDVTDSVSGETTAVRVDLSE